MIEKIRKVTRAGIHSAISLLAGITCAVYPCGAAALPARITLPIEVLGDAGTTARVAFQLQQNEVAHTRFLWLQVHGLEFEGMGGIRMNGCPWVDLSNSTATVAEPDSRYGGIGGGFATLSLALPLPSECLQAGMNSLDFRFNRSDGVVSGFRVLAFNLLRNDGSQILAPENFAEEDPDAWIPPSLDPADRLAGEHLWRQAPLLSSSLPDAHPIRAHCADCHTQDGRDLKYFNYSNRSIIARSRFHGLSEKEGQAIASYIRSLPFPHPGRPWNPPYQPGPELDRRPVSEWAAGAGLEWVLDSDVQALPYLFPGGVITQKAVSPDADLNLRQIPLALQLPDWNHWLPHVAPIDAFGDRYLRSEFARDYLLLQSSHYDAALFEKWTNARGKLLTPPPAESSVRWTPQLSEQMYATQLWQMVKTWELVQQDDLEETTPRRWPNNIAALTAPSAVHIPDSPNGMNGSALSNEYFSNAWYQLQLLLNSGSHQNHGRRPVDWIYVLEHEHTLQKLSGVPEPIRVLITVIKAMQSNDPFAGPQNVAAGWRPDRNVDPRILVDPDWASTFEVLPPATHQSLSQALLAAWLEKTASYPPTEYFARAQLAGSYPLPEDLSSIYGGRVWEAARQFRAAGVDGRLVDALERWGASFTNLAGLYQY